MKTLNLEKMEKIEGGRTCFGEGAAVLAAMDHLNDRYGSEIYALCIAALFDCLGQP